VVLREQRESDGEKERVENSEQRKPPTGRAAVRRVAHESRARDDVRGERRDAREKVGA